MRCPQVYFNPLLAGRRVCAYHTTGHADPRSLQLKQPRDTGHFRPLLMRSPGRVPWSWLRVVTVRRMAGESETPVGLRRTLHQPQSQVFGCSSLAGGGLNPTENVLQTSLHAVSLSHTQSWSCVLGCFLPHVRPQGHNKTCKIEIPSVWFSVFRTTIIISSSTETSTTSIVPKSSLFHNHAMVSMGDA